MINLKKFLEKIGIENAEEILKDIDNAEKEDIVNILLDKAKDYSRPLLEVDMKSKMNDERKTWKGKYLKEALQKANKIFGNKLTNSEIEDIMNDPHNEGKTYDVVLERLKDKVSEKTGKTDDELQKMLDTANGKILEMEDLLNTTKTQYEERLKTEINNIKLQQVLKSKLIEILPKYTSLNPIKASELILNQLKNRAHISLNDDKITLHDLKDINLPLKKNERELQTLEGLISDISTEYELPKAKSPSGTSTTTTTQKDDNGVNRFESEAVQSAKGLAAAFDAVASS